jgi:hypothetical protein
MLSRRVTKNSFLKKRQPQNSRKLLYARNRIEKLPQEKIFGAARKKHFGFNLFPQEGAAAV